MVINCCLVIEHLKPCLGGGCEMTDCPGHQHHITFIRTDLLLPLAALHRFVEIRICPHQEVRLWLPSKLTQLFRPIILKLFDDRSFARRCMMLLRHLLYDRRSFTVCVCLQQWKLLSTNKCQQNGQHLHARNNKRSADAITYESPNCKHTTYYNALIRLHTK
jgi:hypothetical protein